MSTPLLSIRGDDGQMHPVPILGGQVKVGDTAGLPVFTGPGGVAEAKTAEAARETLGLAYETGVWTPRWAGSTTEGDFTYAKQFGSYSRLGNRVHLDFALSVNAIVTAPAGGMCIYNLPFIPRVTNTYYVGQLMVHANTVGLAVGEALGCGITPLSRPGIQFWITRPNAYYVQFGAANITAATTMHGSVSYDCE